MGFPLREVREGNVNLLVPDLDYYLVGNRPEPAHAPVFYNPMMEPNRSISILIINTFLDPEGLVICEPLSGTGARAVRYAVEVKGVAKVIAGDINQEAYRLIKINAERNGVSDVVDARRSDANQLLLELSRSGGCHVVDIDPFGSPMPYIAAGLRAVRSGGLLCVTATDVGVLSGRHRLKCLRRYGALAGNVPFKFEVGLRILIGAIAREALVLDYGVKPIISYMDRYHYRVCLVVNKDRGDAKLTIRDLGYLYYESGERGFIESYPIGGSNKGILGPLWIGELGDPEFLVRLSQSLPRGPEWSRMLELIVEEYLSINKPYVLTSEVGRTIGREESVDTVIGWLRGLGYIGVKTHFHPKGFRTNMPMSKLMRLMRNLAT